MTINYKFREDELIQEFKDYIDATYSGHYGQGKLQSSEVIVDRGHGLGFFLGNVDKYNARYGKKGTPSDHRKDLVKVLHYALLALYEHDRLNSETITITSGCENNCKDCKCGELNVYNDDEIVYNTSYSIDSATVSDWNQAYNNYTISLKSGAK